MMMQIVDRLLLTVMDFHNTQYYERHGKFKIYTQEVPHAPKVKTWEARIVNIYAKCGHTIELRYHESQGTEGNSTFPGLDISIWTF